MKNTYKISGMTCNGCKSHVNEILNAHSDVKALNTDLKTSKTTLEMEKGIPLRELKLLFKNSPYMIHALDEEVIASKNTGTCGGESKK